MRAHVRDNRCKPFSDFHSRVILTQSAKGKNSCIMHQSIPAAPSSPRAAAGHLQILRYPGAGHLPTPGYSRALDTHAVSYQSITTQRILPKKKNSLAHLSRTGGGKRMFSILCTHFFIAYQARIA